MSLIEDLKPFEKELMLHRTHNALPQGDVKNRLCDIYEKHYYNYKKWGVSRPNRSCPSCISDFMRCLTAEWVARPVDNTVEFKGVPQKPVTKQDIQLDPKDVEAFEEGVALTEALNHNYILGLKWGTFKKYCTELGIKVSGKTKKELLKELGI